MTFEQIIFLLCLLVFMLVLYIIHKVYPDDKENEDKEDYIEVMWWTQFVVKEWDELFKKENETIYIDNKLKMKYTIPNTSILYIQQCEKN